jgi:hypothetical protein
VRALYWPQHRYPPKPTAADLDTVENGLGFKFPASYRAFAQEFGLDGELHGGLPHVLPLWPPADKPAADWWDAVALATQFYRTYDWGIRGDDRAALRELLRRVVVFAIDESHHTWVFDPSDVTDAKLSEYRIYDITRETEAVEIAMSFPEWLDWIDGHYRFEQDEEEEGEPEFPPVYKPDSPKPDAMIYSRRHPFEERGRPDRSDVALWLAFNNHTARDLALSIRDRGQTDAFPILADALQEAGCANADLLDSCRTGDPDIDGVWVLRVLLGES